MVSDFFFSVLALWPSYEKCLLSNIDKLYLAPSSSFRSFYVNTLKDENMFILIREITTYFNFFDTLFAVKKKSSAENVCVCV